MRELYISPDVKLVSFVSAERLASNNIDFDELLKGGSDTAVIPNASGDVEVEINL